MIWSQSGQIISFSWDIKQKSRLIQQIEPTHLYTYESLSRNPGSAPDMSTYGRLLEIFAHMRTESSCTCPDVLYTFCGLRFARADQKC